MSKGPKPITVVAVVVLCMVMALTDARTASGKVIKVGILDDDANGPQASFWQSTIDYLNQTVAPNDRFVLEVLNDHALLTALQNKTVSCAIVDPALAAMAGTDIRQLASSRCRYNDREFEGGAAAIVVRKARPDLRNWSDLRTAEIVTAHTMTLADWRAAERELKSAGWRGRLRMVSTRSEALSEVAQGRSDAAVVPAGFLESLPVSAELSPDTFHVIVAPRPGGDPSAPWPVAASTPAYPGHTFVVMTTVPPEQQRRIAAALLAMPAAAAAPNGVSGKCIEGAGWDVSEILAPVVDLLAELGVPPYAKRLEISLADVARQYMYVFALIGLTFVVALGFIATLTALNRVLRAEVIRRREAEKSLRTSIERFEHITACSSDWIWECDEHGVYTYTNPNVRSMLGYEPQEILGRHHLELLAALDRERLEAEGRYLFNEGRRLFREVYRMRTKDGRVVVHEITAEPVRDSDGKLIGYRGVNRDITDRARAVRLMT